MPDAAWPSEWLRGVLEPCVLRVLVEGPTYGYAIAERLDAAGLGRPKGGTLYPLLGRMEAAGHVTVEWRAGDGGPGRKYYALTAQGRDALADAASRWAAFTATTGAHLGADPGSTSSTSTSTSSVRTLTAVEDR
ncbi:PadR family transcriptional regulator [Cellulomonas marina]|uniref:PadR family transcriptional regulator, regulatory protein PadR n=1 Tax=Cellulomonas marina TaxID=988821 RepID=A0A1I0XGZ9_9CELL|nr:PadR family transcriptional regulator [Cellulomonas marina]GIG29847.1 transcriptional regulator [Cellulomonas marina]SFA99967.1 PadR family transcriptional regulator, regulatory protein PadR [Cellulomonas marina]